MNRASEHDQVVAGWLDRLACEPDWRDELRREPDEALARLTEGMPEASVVLLRSLILHGGVLEVRAAPGRPWAGWGIGC